MKKEILVIGGTGNIGNTLVELLRENNINYRLLVRSETSEESAKVTKRSLRKRGPWGMAGR